MARVLPDSLEAAVTDIVEALAPAALPASPARTTPVRTAAGAGMTERAARSLRTLRRPRNA